MSHPENDKLIDLFLEECTTEWRCSYCGGPATEERPFCCGEFHCTKMLCSRDGQTIGEDSSVRQECFERWLEEREKVD